MLAILWKCAMFEVPNWEKKKKKTPFLTISKPYKLINQDVNFQISLNLCNITTHLKYIRHIMSKVVDGKY